MANIKVPNLCGANAEFNSVQSKFESLLSDAIAGLESEASSLASTLDSAVTSLTTDLRDLMPEVPSLPDANLQSLLTSLSGLIPGTPEYITLLDEITTKFGTELAAAGHTLETLITNARTQIEGGGDLWVDLMDDIGVLLLPLVLDTFIGVIIIHLYYPLNLIC